MSSHEPEPLAASPRPESAGVSAPPPAIGTAARADEVPFHLGDLRRLAVAAAILAGVVAWLGGEAIHGRYDAPLLDSFNPRSKEMGAMVASATIREAMRAFGMLGAALGLAMGLAGGIARRSGAAAFAAGGLGLILGAVAGAGSVVELVPYYLKYVNRDGDDLIWPLLTHGGLWSAVGAAGGLALGVGLGGWRRTGRALLGGLIGALAAVLVFEVVGPLAFPLAKTGEPISETWGSRLFARLAVAILAAAGAVLAVQDPKPRHTVEAP
jgi:hypothetical protein